MPQKAAGGTAELLQFLYLTPVGIVKFDAGGSIELINAAAAQLLLPLQPGADLANIYAALAPLMPDLEDRVRAFAPGAGAVLNQRRFEFPSGSNVMAVSLTVQRIEADVYMAVLEDVTAFVAQERKLSANERQFRALCDHVRDYAIYTIAADGRVEEWNHSLRRFGGWEAADVEGRHVSIFFPGHDNDGSRVATLLADAERLGSAQDEGWLVRRDGSSLWGEIIATSLAEGSRTGCGFLVIVRDMTERKRMQDDLYHLATVDSLTGAFNRRHGLAALTAELTRHARSGEPFAIMMLDVDRFKSINDLHGHDAGDAVLCAIVGILKARLRACDVFSRWGGEEFLVVLPATNPLGATNVAERLREKVAAVPVPFAAAATPIAITISIGVAAISENETCSDPGELLRRADDALYRAKSGGRNRVELAPLATDGVSDAR